MLRALLQCATFETFIITHRIFLFTGRLHSLFTHTHARQERERARARAREGERGFLLAMTARSALWCLLLCTLCPRPAARDPQAQCGKPSTVSCAKPIYSTSTAALLRRTNTALNLFRISTALSISRASLHPNLLFTALQWTLLNFL